MGGAYETEPLLEEIERADVGMGEEEQEPFVGDGGDRPGAIHVARPQLPGVRPRPRGRATRGRPTLKRLGSFSRWFVQNLIAARRRVDCADLAIALWITFAARNRLPMSFRIWVAAERRFRTFSGRQFRTRTRFIRFIQDNLGARGLIGNTYNIAGGHRAAVSGDVYLWEYFHERTNRRHRWGHTQIVDRVIRGAGGPETDTIIIVQGTLPPAVPEFRTRRATYFSRPRRAMIGGEPHIGRCVGGGPRRFRGFQQLR